MSMHVALLRGINVGGHNAVAMSDLRNLCGALGLEDAKTLLQSGNLVFQSNGKSATMLERLLETETAKRLKLSIDCLVRSAMELKKIIAGNPFPKQAKREPSHLLVMFLKSAPSVENVDSLQAAIQGPELLRNDGKHLYIVYPNGIGRSKLTGTLIERQLDTRGTARNWNTVLKLVALCQKETK